MFCWQNKPEMQIFLKKKKKKNVHTRLFTLMSSNLDLYFVKLHREEHNTTWVTFRCRGGWSCWIYCSFLWFHTWPPVVYLCVCVCVCVCCSEGDGVLVCQWSLHTVNHSDPPHSPSLSKPPVPPPSFSHLLPSFLHPSICLCVYSVLSTNQGHGWK